MIFFLLISFLFSPNVLFAYIDPGSGFVFLQNTSFFWGWIIGALMFLLLPFKFFFKSLKKFFWIFFILVIILVIFGGLIMKTRVAKEKIIVLGIDAMDAHITEQLMNEGKLPNFSYLKETGSFSPLKTTNPAESIVAWSSFMTGLNPGSHGVFDFIMRDPKDYMPFLGFDEIAAAADKPQIQIRRKGEAFWEALSKSKIPSFIYFCPNTFPPTKIYGRMISGMGVTDILGFIGKFSFYTTKALSLEDRNSRGRIVRVFPNNNIIQTEIYGPKINLRGSITETKVPIGIVIIPEKNEVLIKFQGNRFILKKNNWSTWLRVSFKVGTFKKTYGIVRFYLKDTGPDFELYCSPINFDPERPTFPISYPNGFSAKLAKKTGLFYTQGMPHDTWALSENRLDERAFLEHTDEIFEERRKILHDELEKFRAGVFFSYFETLDSVQHMFWRYIDPKHPLYEAKSRYQETIFSYYEKMDQILGDILKKTDKDTTLIVLSDHGFTSFRKAAHLNRWLLENGFLFLKEDKDESPEFFEDVDWSKTKAYALGFGGIYINLSGREKYGIVDEKDKREVKSQIVEKLSKWQDPSTGENVIKQVYDGEKIFTGPYAKTGPDLFVGFDSGFRASWQTALGGAPKLLIEDNKKKWSGDHLVDPSLVPGVIFINKKVKLNEPYIYDVAPAVLRFFGISDSKEAGRERIILDGK